MTEQKLISNQPIATEINSSSNSTEEKSGEEIIYQKQNMTEENIETPVNPVEEPNAMDRNVVTDIIAENVDAEELATCCGKLCSAGIKKAFSSWCKKTE